MSTGLARRWWLALWCLGLAGCGGGSASGVGRAAAVECAPFARALTGVALSGAAADWWPQAAGRYVRSNTPEVGSVLVLRRSGRLPSGHVAVVSRVLSRREITVTQANWVHHRVTEDQLVVDTSEHGDWSAVRMWWPPTDRLGTSDYAAFGFIRPDHPFGREQLRAATPAAIRLARDG